MEQYDHEMAAVTAPAILQLGPLIAPRSQPITPTDAANEFARWQALAGEQGVVLPTDWSLGRYARVLRRDIIPDLGVLAELSILGESVSAMPDTPYGKQLGTGHIIFPQVVANNHVTTALNANYRMFNTGYADVELHVGDMPEHAIHKYMEHVWGRLALDQVLELPVGDIQLPPRQIGPQQVRALGAYMGELRLLPR